VQPLAHAALMRDGGPASWAAMCLPGAAAQNDGDGTTPIAGRLHECCLGFAHAAPASEPPSIFVLVDERPVLAQEALAPVGIRDGPSQPRAPPVPV
jgi:hypothetical protein